MAEDRTFTLIGKFTDEITPKLRSINEQINALNGTIAKFKSNGRDLSKEFASVATSLSAVSSAARANRIALRNSNEDLNKYLSTLKKVQNEQERILKYTPRGISGGGGRTTVPSGAGSSGGSSYSGIGVGGVVQANLIANAITGAFRMGVNIVQDGMSTVFNVLAERSKDQMEDIASAGGIYSAAKYSNVKGLPNTFQGAMDLQNQMNKELAAMASNLPGTTHDFVENGRRLTDTISLVMAKDGEEFRKVAARMTGNVKIGADQAFIRVTDELTKRTTLLEKINPARTVVPMSQLVEDMIKSDKVSEGGLRRYIAFRRGTTFQAALERHINEVNATGASTAARIEAINKLLQEAVPQPMINAMQRSVAGVTEGFKSALLDPDVGIFGLSRNLTQLKGDLSTQFKKFNAETGAFMANMDENINLFKILSDIFGNLGNLINNSIMPGLFAIYNPFEKIAQGLAKLREFTFRIFEQQQRYTQYFDDLAGKYGMTNDAFKVAEKGGVTVIMDLLRAYNGLSAKDYNRFAAAMKAPGSEEEVAKRMKNIYAQIIPAIFNSPLFANIGKDLGTMLANIFKEIANLMDTLLKQNGGIDAFITAFNESGGQDAVNRIVVDILEGIWRLVKYVVKTYLSALGTAIMRGNFAVAGILGAGLLAAGVTLFNAINGLVVAYNTLSGWTAAGAARLGLTRAATAGGAALSAGTEIAETAAAQSATARYMRLSENRMAGTILRPAVGAGIGATEAAGAAGAGAAAVEGGSLVGGLASIPVAGWIAAAAAAVIVFQKPLLGLADFLTKTGQKLEQSKSWMQSSFGQLIQGLGELTKGITNFFGGLWDIVSGLLSGDTDKVIAGIKKLFSSIGDLFVGIGRTVGGLGGIILTAVMNLFKVIGEVISRLAAKIFNITPGALSGQPIVGPDGKPIVGVQPASPLPAPTPSAPPVPGFKWRAQAPAFGSANAYHGTLLDAIAFETKHKPQGSDLVIANSSETIIPAAAMGYFPASSLIGDRSSNRAQQTSVNAPITIYQQPGQSPKELAALVAMEISNAVADVRNSSYYV